MPQQCPNANAPPPNYPNTVPMLTSASKAMLAKQAPLPPPPTLPWAASIVSWAKWALLPPSHLHPGPQERSASQCIISPVPKQSKQSKHCCPLPIFGCATAQLTTPQQCPNANALPWRKPSKASQATQAKLSGATQTEWSISVGSGTSAAANAPPPPMLLCRRRTDVPTPTPDIAVTIAPLQPHRRHPPNNAPIIGWVRGWH